MYLHRKVKDREGVIIVTQMMVDISFLLVGQCLAMTVDPVPEGFRKTFSVLSASEVVNGEVGGAVIEVVAEGQLNVSGTFDDGWAQIFVAVNDHEGVRGLKIMEGTSLVREKVGSTFPFPKEGFDGVSEGSAAVFEDWITFPGGWFEGRGSPELGIVVRVVGCACEGKF